MMMVMMIINSDDDDNEEGNGSHFSWQEYKYFFIRHLVIRSDILLLYACVYNKVCLQTNASTAV